MPPAGAIPEHTIPFNLNASLTRLEVPAAAGSGLLSFGGPTQSMCPHGFSRKLANHAAATALNYFAYNFIKIHRTLRKSPAMAAGVTDRLLSVEDLPSGKLT